MHASFVLKNAKGDNMPAKDAVYFTAHHDKSGKLMEVTSPNRLSLWVKKIMRLVILSEMERYTPLPVTKKTYNEMMTEVAKNQGMGN